MTLRTRFKKGVAAATAAAASLFVWGCAAGGVGAADDSKAIPEAEQVQAELWLNGFTMVDPITAAVSACAHLRAGGATEFNDRLTGVGLTGAQTWTGSPTGFLEAAMFDLYRSDTVRLRMSANLLDGESVCAVRFEGRLGAAVWENRRRWFQQHPVWTRPGEGPGPMSDEGARRFVKATPDEYALFVFTEATRRDPPGLLIEFRRPPLGASVD